jgi:hypothetical protein
LGINVTRKGNSGSASVSGESGRRNESVSPESTTLAQIEEWRNSKFLSFEERWQISREVI